MDRQKIGFYTNPYDDKYSLIIPEKVNYLLCDPSQKPSEFWVFPQPHLGLFNFII